MHEKTQEKRAIGNNKKRLTGAPDAAAFKDRVLVLLALEDHNMAGEMATLGPQRSTADESSLTCGRATIRRGVVAGAAAAAAKLGFFGQECRRKWLCISSRDYIRNSQRGSLYDPWIYMCTLFGQECRTKWQRPLSSPQGVQPTAHSRSQVLGHRAFGVDI